MGRLSNPLESRREWIEGMLARLGRVRKLLEVITIKTNEMENKSLRESTLKDVDEADYYVRSVQEQIKLISDGGTEL